MNMIARIEPAAIRLAKKLEADGDLDQARCEMGWTATRTRVAIALFNSGLSAREVADAIGGVSRNAVIGKVHRSEAADPNRKLPLGSTDQCTGVRQERKPRQRRRTHDRGSVVRTKAPVEKPIPPSVVDQQIPIEQRRTLAQLDDACCHWPVGDPREANFFFCGAPKASDEDVPYCRSHQYRSRQPDSVRRKPVGAAFVNAGPAAAWRAR